METLKIATKYKYLNGRCIVAPGDVFTKDSIIDYDSVEGNEVTLKDLAKIYIEVDNLFYNIANQWEDGCDLEYFMQDLRSAMYDMKS